MSEEEYSIVIRAGEQFSAEEWRSSWTNDVELVDVTKHSTQVARLISLFMEQQSNWQVLFKQFRIDAYSGEGGVASAANFHPAVHLFDFLQHADVSALVPPVDEVELALTKDPQQHAVQFGLQQISAYHFIADVAAAISWAGAYSRAPISGEATLAVALELYKEISVGHEFGSWEIDLYRLGHDWSSWFYGVAWDHAWLWFDRKKEVISLFCATDTD